MARYVLNTIPSTLLSHNQTISTLREIMMKNFTIAFAALAAITFTSSTIFAATPYSNSSQYNTRYNSNINQRSWNNQYRYQTNNHRSYLNPRRTTNQYDYLSNRFNELSSGYQCSTRPAYNASYSNYRSNTRSYPYNNNRFDYSRNYDYGRSYNNNQFDYNRNNYNWRAGR